MTLSIDLGLCSKKAVTLYNSTLNVLYGMVKRDRLKGIVQPKLSLSQNDLLFLHLCNSKPVFPFIHRRKRLFEECSCCCLLSNAMQCMQSIHVMHYNPILLKHKIRYQISRAQTLKSIVFIFCFFLTNRNYM